MTHPCHLIFFKKKHLLVLLCVCLHSSSANSALCLPKLQGPLDLGAFSALLREKRFSHFSQLFAFLNISKFCKYDSVWSHGNSERLCSGSALQLSATASLTRAIDSVVEIGWDLNWFSEETKDTNKESLNHQSLCGFDMRWFKTVSCDF